MEAFQEPFSGLGSDISLTLVGTDQASARRHLSLLKSEIVDFEQRFSRFLPTSELTRVNQQAGLPTSISAEFYDLMREALRQSKHSEGIYTPLLLPELQRAGYQASWPHPDAKPAAPLFLERGGASWQDVTLTHDTIHLPATAAIDFGGIGKGYLLGQLANRTRPHFHNFWFSLGGDIVSLGLDPAGRPWQIFVAQAQNPQHMAGSFSSNATQAVATSGVTKRRGMHAGKPWHHLIDPRTGSPADTDILTATVQHKDPTTADVLAKSAVITGSAQAWLFVECRGATGLILQLKTSGDLKVIKYGSAL